MPAIVDRSPVIVAVGTAGNSPTLARRLRAQLEAVLPERLGELALLAGRLRERVREALPDLRRRQQFWERLFDGAVASQVLAGHGEGAVDMVNAQLEALCAAGSAAPVDAPEARGEVYLIGAGPGDPDLLTLRAQQLLQQADVVLYDRLVSEAVLARARREADARLRRQGIGASSRHAGAHSRPAAASTHAADCGWHASRAAIRSSSAAAARRSRYCGAPACR